MFSFIFILLFWKIRPTFKLNPLKKLFNYFCDELVPGEMSFYLSLPVKNCLFSLSLSLLFWLIVFMTIKGKKRFPEKKNLVDISCIIALSGLTSSLYNSDCTNLVVVYISLTIEFHSRVITGSVARQIEPNGAVTVVGSQNPNRVNIWRRVPQE